MSAGYVSIPSSDPQDPQSTTVAMSITSDRYSGTAIKRSYFHISDIFKDKCFYLRIVEQKIGRPSHKMVVLLHSVFKVAALTIYLGSSFITNSFIGSFIIIMMLLSADFWVVKNISGRLLAYVKIAIPW